jgi:hypothetical protein
MEVAREPNDLALLLVERLNARDVDGIVALYEQDAVLALTDGSLAEGAESIRGLLHPSAGTSLHPRQAVRGAGAR